MLGRGGEWGRGPATAAGRRQHHGRGLQTTRQGPHIDLYYLFYIYGLYIYGFKLLDKVSLHHLLIKGLTYPKLRHEARRKATRITLPSYRSLERLYYTNILYFYIYYIYISISIYIYMNICVCIESVSTMVEGFKLLDKVIVKYLYFFG
jgi:hypothetical protein